MKIDVLCHEVGKDPLYKTWHAGAHHLFTYMYSDGGSVVTSERIFPIRKGALVFLRAGTYHYTIPDNPDAYNRSKLIVSEQIFSKLRALLGKNPTFSAIFNKSLVYAVVAPADRASIDRIFKTVAACAQDESREPLLLACLLELVYLLNRDTVESTPTPAGITGRVIEYINANIASINSLDTICSAIGMSKYHCCRQFKEHTGMTVMRYILKTRVVLAKGELETSAASVTEISEHFGFSSVSHFCQVFKDEMGLSPLQYRKRFQA